MLKKNSSKSLVINRNNISALFKLAQNKKVLAELNRILTYAKNLGIGRVEKQQIYLNQNEIKLMKTIFSWWQLMCDNEAPNFRTKEETEVLQKNLLRSFFEKDKFKFILILCPAYKKGKGQNGLKSRIGRTTKKRIDFALNFLIETKKLGIKADLEICFSDIILENYSDKEKESWDFSLERNLKQIKEHALKRGDEVTISRLSEKGLLDKIVGKKGVDRESNIPQNLISVATRRSALFYKNALGWSDVAVRKRMKILAYAYQKIGECIKKEEFTVMIFGENLYERGRMYSGDQKEENIIPIIYPPKED